MPRPVTQAGAVAEAVRVSAVAHQRTCWIGIDGPGAAGKSTLARRIAARVERAVVVPVDDFWGPSIPEWDWSRFIEQAVVPLRSGRNATYQEWDWDLDMGGPWHEIVSGSVVIVEGVSSTRDEVAVPWDLTIWVETPVDVRLARARERDGAALMHRWFADWIPSEERYIAAQHPQQRVDLVVSGAAD
ncbi:MAG: hypothetical protein QOG80_908 [Pseudonocardiales bacterium]|jgi:uridine kinase|nr:hypothetical protein [Pseudonocardiales bacterium]